ncbi:hypothetical protein DPEC_G00297710 [Dallia pectoralis]|uniref:Uncharacterized protein n=1 Tax=Dallia pectoralis TaxID=75939 RepID=A0ACC2FFS1_DALPE|nr:hypothetical protein DPEC_G00297710 [Dallia pectoralis]
MATLVTQLIYKELPPHRASTPPPMVPHAAQTRTVPARSGVDLAARVVCLFCLPDILGHLEFPVISTWQLERWLVWAGRPRGSGRSSNSGRQNPRENPLHTGNPLLSPVSTVFPGGCVCLHGEATVLSPPVSSAEARGGSSAWKPWGPCELKEGTSSAPVSPACLDPSPPRRHPAPQRAEGRGPEAPRRPERGSTEGFLYPEQ